MLIREMSWDECLLVLARTRLAKLGCARGNQPYVVPVSLVYHQPANDYPCLYGVTIPGQKVEWMRANPLVCVEVDEVAADDRWLSVIVFGRYEELPETSDKDDTPKDAQERLLHFPERSDLTQIAEEKTEPLNVAGTAETKPVPATPTNAAIPTPPKRDEERLTAYRLLSTQTTWWERGWATWVARPHPDPTETYKIIYYKIRIERVTGHEATRVAKETIV